jgi:hypothetical protein
LLVNDRDVDAALTDHPELVGAAGVGERDGCLRPGGSRAALLASARRPSRTKR